MDDDSARSSFIAYDCFSYLEFYAFHYDAVNCFGILMGIAANLLIGFGWMAIFTLNPINL